MGKSIVKRWVINYLSITILFLVVIIFAGAFGVRTYYYDGVKRELSRMCGDAVRSYSQLESAVPFNDWAGAYVDSFSGPQSAQAAAADKSGNVFRSSSDEDHEELSRTLSQIHVESPDSSSYTTINLPSGEKVMCCAVKTGRGTLYFYETLTDADNKIMLAIIILFSTVMLLLASFVIPCLLFMKTIVKPVRELRATAHRIAQGDLETRVDKMYDDEIGELADSINHMAEEIKASDSMKNDFISSVSHELRTPLTAIKGWAETMSLGVPDKDTMNKGLGIIINESERLTGMVEELLDFSRIQSGRMILAMDKTDLLAELGEAVYMLRERASKERKHFVYDEPETMPPVLADKNRLRQVFINIIDNALKYTPVGGVIGIDVKQEDDKIKVIISDTGCGINEKDLPRIKEKFYKANKTVRGSGIGLAVADEIVTLHKGSLTIDSKEDVGTTVTISIPILDRDDEEILKS